MRRVTTVLIGWVVVTGLPRGAATAQELTAANYETLRDQIDVKPEELLWQNVSWLSFWDGLVAAQTQDWPIFYWVYFGDPRGGC